ncbi:MAG TPA: hypothetical protein VGF20_10095 [Candidatus Acidoferrum sp.]|jgi:hypothetical protein
MRISIIAARLRRVARGLEILAAKQGDSDLPEEMVSPFIVDVVTAENRAAQAVARDRETQDLNNFQTSPTSMPGTELWPKY